jgi:WD40 repeat protein
LLRIGPPAAFEQGTLQPATQGKDQKEENKAGGWNEIATFSRGSGEFAFSPDGELIAKVERLRFDAAKETIGTFDDYIGFYEVRTQKRSAELKTGARGAMAFAPKGKAFAATAAGDFRTSAGLRVWESPGAANPLHLEWPTPLRPSDPFTTTMVFSSDRAFLATGWNTGKVQVWKIRDVWENKAPPMKPLSEFKVEGKVRSMEFDRSFKRLAVASIDGSVRVWDVAGAKQVAAFESPMGQWEKGLGDSYETRCAAALAFSPDGRKLAVVDLRALRLLDVATQKEIAQFPWEAKQTLNGRAFCAAFSPDAANLAVGFANGFVRLWSLDELWQKDRAPASKATLVQGGEDASPVGDIAFSPNGRLIGARLVLGLRIWEQAPEKPGKVATEEAIAKWIKDLGHELFKVRESATTRRQDVFGLRPFAERKATKSPGAQSNYASSSLTTSPYTSVRRKSLPA